MKVLILGVGNAQIDAVNYCKNAGHEVYGCSYTNVEKGIPLLHHFDQRNIVDVDSILEYAEQEQIDVVYSVGSDIAMPTACAVSEKLGLPHFVSYETAKICNNKQLMRQTLGPEFKGNIPYVVAGTKEELQNYNGFPGIIKPVDSQGQRGVYRVDSLEEAYARFDESVSYSKAGKVILEQFLEGREVSVNAYMVDGKMAFGLVSDRISFSEFPGGIIKEHYIPSSFSKAVQDKTIDLTCRVMERLEIRNGPCYFQIKVVDDEPYILEVTPRLDGCHMWKLIRYATGVDLLDATFRHLLEGKADQKWFSAASSPKPVRTVFMCQAPGTVLEEKPEYPDALEVCWYYDVGDSVRKMNGYMEKCGYRMESLQ